jgi:hypothetical protein
MIFIYLAKRTSLPCVSVNMGSINFVLSVNQKTKRNKKVIFVSRGLYDFPEWKAIKKFKKKHENETAKD